MTFKESEISIWELNISKVKETAKPKTTCTKCPVKLLVRVQRFISIPHSLAYEGIRFQGDQSDVQLILKLTPWTRAVEPAVVMS